MTPKIYTIVYCAKCCGLERQGLAHCAECGCDKYESVEIEAECYQDAWDLMVEEAKEYRRTEAKTGCEDIVSGDTDITAYPEPIAKLIREELFFNQMRDDEIDVEDLAWRNR